MSLGMTKCAASGAFLVAETCARGLGLDERLGLGLELRITG